jgi:hypothetical protein
MPLRGWIWLFDTPDLFSLLVKQPGKLAMVDDPAIVTTDFRNFLLDELAILCLDFEVNKL